eukprot:1471980-Pyramimonas_sp.AAC.1
MCIRDRAQAVALAVRRLWTWCREPSARSGGWRSRRAGPPARGCTVGLCTNAHLIRTDFAWPASVTIW